MPDAPNLDLAASRSAPAGRTDPSVHAGPTHSPDRADGAAPGGRAGTTRPPKQEQLPAERETVELAPGILRIQLPIAMPGLGHVNAYVLTGGTGPVVVDAGLPGPATMTALTDGLGQAGIALRDIQAVVVTHSHPDHFGAAGELADAAGAPVVVHGAFRSWWAPEHHLPVEEIPDVDPADLDTENPMLLPTPWGGESLAAGWARSNEDRWTAGWTPPVPGVRLRDGERIRLGAREWVALHTPGHTIDHLCLFEPETGVLLSGDHVLPTITPHVPGVGGGRDALGAYEASLSRVAALPGVQLVAPAHGLPFSDLAGRVAAIRAHHEARLAEIVGLVAEAEPVGVAELSQRLFRRERWGPMAESETYAHLEHLRRTGRVRLVEGRDGARYVVSGSAA